MLSSPMRSIRKLNPALTAKNACIDVVATGLWALAIQMIIIPNQIAPGGASGITIVISYLTEAQIGALSFLINLPLLIWAWRILGHNFVIQTMITITIFTLMMDYVAPLFGSYTYTNDPLLGAILAGVLNGVGTGLMFMHGSSGGGTDLLTRIIKRMHPHLSVGQIVLTINSVIMAVAGWVYGSFDALLYGLIMTFTCGQVIDLILNGASSANSITIMTSKPTEIGDLITQKLHRSATIVRGEGAYSHSEVAVMFCVVRKHELQKLKDLVLNADSKSFLIVHDAKQVSGGNFVSRNPLS